MRILLGLAIIALVADTAALGQSLADAARSERERRRAIPQRGVAYTNDDLQSRYAGPENEESSPEESDFREIERLQNELSQPGLEDADRIRLAMELAQARLRLSEGEGADTPDGVSQVGDTGGSPPVLATTPPPGRAEQAWIEWQARVADQETLVGDLEDQQVAEALEIGRLRAELTAPRGSQRDRDVTRSDLEAAQARLDVTQAALEAARTELERLRVASPPVP